MKQSTGQSTYPERTARALSSPAGELGAARALAAGRAVRVALPADHAVAHDSRSSPACGFAHRSSRVPPPSRRTCRPSDRCSSSSAPRSSPAAHLRTSRCTCRPSCPSVGFTLYSHGTREPHGRGRGMFVTRERERLMRPRDRRRCRSACPPGTRRTRRRTAVGTAGLRRPSCVATGAEPALVARGAATAVAALARAVAAQAGPCRCSVPLVQSLRLARTMRRPHPRKTSRSRARSARRARPQRTPDLDHPAACMRDTLAPPRLLNARRGTRRYLRKKRVQSPWRPLTKAVWPRIVRTLNFSTGGTGNSDHTL